MDFVDPVAGGAGGILSSAREELGSLAGSCMDGVPRNPECVSFCIRGCRPSIAIGGDCILPSAPTGIGVFSEWWRLTCDQAGGTGGSLKGGSGHKSQKSSHI